ncbi:MAG: hypothetical protein KJ600_04305 [Nanoarchaeota archaeon]|nr:hypothetical protein [Nanoarchaeota archaeon]MBU1103750.1 hypothetical protein [Nanoarchaeota archaeon]
MATLEIKSSQTLKARNLVSEDRVLVQPDQGSELELFFSETHEGNYRSHSERARFLRRVPGTQAIDVISYPIHNGKVTFLHPNRDRGYGPKDEGHSERDAVLRRHGK